MRKAILNALRVPVQKRLRQSVKFDVADIVVSSSYAYVNATPVRPDGGAVDYSGLAEFAPAIKAGAFDDGLEALLHKVHGRWKVLKCRIGATDTEYGDWAEKYHLRMK